ncbi:hypothetical protein BUALT_Bualt01G0205700 [Buddleja alternifolia]|uniref:BHLH domain-containing protein n=1 Tax=Buddleja alternifolia TaxID=168488 RepID=A0AAV6Y9P8_9LAMI|nr:hypothetical protein BUALT_Bualt01G0205700 [Buddleja alternifolia]
MNQCVPSWDLDENSAPPRLDVRAHSNSLPHDVPSLDYEVAELTWENGHLAMHGLGPPRVVNKPTVSISSAKYAAWDKPRAGGTLESIVNQATSHPNKSAVESGGGKANDLVPWFSHHRPAVNPNGGAAVTMTMDALVPCNNNIVHRNDHNQDRSTRVLDSGPVTGTCRVGCSTRVGSCSGAAAPFDCGAKAVGVARVGMSGCKTNLSVGESATCGGSRHMTVDTCEREFGGAAFTSTSLASPENTSSGKEYTRTSGDDHDSACHSRSQACITYLLREVGEEGKRKGTGKSSVSTNKRSRAAAIHNQSERKRRDKINERMKTLQKMVPNSSKTDKASMLDEVIEYLKQLQAQVNMMSRMNMSPMMLPLAMQQQLQMSMMAPMGMGMGMGMGLGMGVMDMNSIGRASVVPPAAAFMPIASWDNPGDRLPTQPTLPDPLSAFFACQSQPTTMDAYSRLAALYQQLQQPPAGSGAKN